MVEGSAHVAPAAGTARSPQLIGRTGSGGELPLLDVIDVDPVRGVATGSRCGAPGLEVICGSANDESTHRRFHGPLHPVRRCPSASPHSSPLRFPPTLFTPVPGPEYSCSGPGPAFGTSSARDRSRPSVAHGPPPFQRAECPARRCSPASSSWSAPPRCADGIDQTSIAERTHPLRARMLMRLGTPAELSVISNRRIPRCPFSVLTSARDAPRRQGTGLTWRGMAGGDGTAGYSRRRSG